MRIIKNISFKKRTLLVALMLILAGYACFALETASVEPSPATENSEASQPKKKKTGKLTDEEKAVAKELASQKTDAYLGVVYVPKKKYEISSGNLRVAFNASSGTFNIYVKGENKKETALLARYNDSSSTSLYVMAGKNIFNLSKDAAVLRELRKTEKGAELAYSVENDFQAVSDFELLSSSPDKTADIVKITVYVTNTSTTAGSFALKGVFDTVLGEGSDYHFSTASGEKIDRERQFDSMESARVIISSNPKASMQLVLDGSSVSSPEKVSISNITNLQKDAWLFVSVADRSFHSITAYNNSAVAVNWPKKSLAAGETFSVVFYIGAGADGNIPDVLAYLDSLESYAEQSVEINYDAENKSGELETFPRRTDVDFIIPPVTERQLDPEYIQSLINRIDALQSDPQSVDRQEVRQLNAELDAILETIRQRN